MILDKQRKLLISIGEDGQNKEFHVEDFVGLYPAWPIVEKTMLPTGNAKEKKDEYICEMHLTPVWQDNLR